MKKIISLALAASVVTAPIVLADGEGQRHSESVKRHNVMEIVKYSGLTLLDAARSKMDISNDQLKVYAKILSDAAHLSTKSFNIDTRAVEGKSDSKDAVWEDFEDFSERMNKFAADTDALVDAVNVGDKKVIATATKQVFSNCKSCHDKYRKEDS